jgi:hypothetical protein
MNHFADESFCNSTGCGHRFGRVSAGATLLPDSPRFLLTQSEEGVTWQKVLVSYRKCPASNTWLRAKAHSPGHLR